MPTTSFAPRSTQLPARTRPIAGGAGHCGASNPARWWRGVRLSRLGRAWLSLALAAAVASGQNSHTSKVSVPDDLVVREYLARAQEALGQGDRERALDIWQEVLDRLAGKVVEAHRAPRRGTETDVVLPEDRFGGVREQVMDRIRTLPDDGLARYQARMEPRAAALLLDGRNHQDEGRLRQCIVRFFLTPSGAEAYLGLVDLMLEQGRFDEARIATQRFQQELDDERRPRYEPLLAARHALCLWGLRDLSGLADLANALGSNRDANVTIAGDEVPLAAFLAELASTLSSPPAGQREELPEVKIFGDRDWTVSLERNSRPSNTVMFGGSSNDWSDHRSVVPVVHDGVVYICDGRSIRAINLFTGTLAWPQLTGPPELQGLPNYNVLYEPVVDKDLLLAYVQGEPALQGQEAWQGFQPVETIPKHHLVAVDRSTGDVVWSHLVFTAKSAEETEFISRLNVNQPPLVRGDTIYVAGTVLIGVFHHWICAFDRGTGQLRWRTYTGSGQMELNMFGNPVKEGVPGHVTEADGVLYYSTNIGVVCAVDAITGTILWESAYEQEPIPSTDSPTTRERLPGWVPSRPAIHGKLVFFAPTDSPHVLVANREDGVLTTIPNLTRRTNNRYRWFLGIHGGSLIVAGREIVAIDPSNLSMRWRIEPGTRRSPMALQGRPALTESSIFFTASGPDGTQLARADLVSGSMKEQQVVQHAGREGNVAVSGDAIVVASDSVLGGYFDINSVERSLSRSAERPDCSPDLLMRLGDVRLRRGQAAQALAAYERALKAARERGPAGREMAERARLSLYNSWMSLATDASLRTPPPEERFQKAMEFARTDAQRLRALLECLDWGLGGSGNDAAITRTLNSLEENFADTLVTISPRVNGLVPEIPAGSRMPAGLMTTLVAGVRAEATRNLRRATEQWHRIQVRYADVPLGSDSAWKFAGDRIQRLIATHGRGVYEALDREARTRLEAAEARGDLNEIRLILRHFPQSQAVESAYLTLSRRLLAQGSYREALSEMQQHFARFGGTSAGALYEYFRCLRELGAHDSARHVLTTLARRYPKEVLVVDERRVAVDSWTREVLAQPPWAHDAPPIPNLEAGLGVKWTIKAQEPDELISIIEPAGNRPERAAGLVLAHLDRELVAIEARTGTPKWTRPSATQPRNPTWFDGRLIAIIDGDLVSWDPGDGTEHWRTRPDVGEMTSVACGHGKVYAMVASHALAGVQWESVDVASGALVQRKSLPGRRQAALQTSPGLVMVTSQGMAYAFDGYTGEPVGKPQAFSPSPQDPQPVLNEEDQLVVIRAANRSSRGTSVSQVEAKDLTTDAVLWSHEVGTGRPVEILSTPSLLALETRDVRRASEQTRPHQVVVFELNSGKLLFQTDLQENSLALQAKVAGDWIYLGMLESSKVSVQPQRVRAHRLNDRTLDWASTEFAGTNFRLVLFPTRDFLLIRKVPTGRRRPDDPNVAELYFVENKSGRAVDLLDLSDSIATPDGSGLTVVDEVLVLNTGGQIRGWAK